MLPVVDRHLLLFQRWVTEWLAGIDDVEHRRLLERFATWHLQRELRTIAEQQSSAYLHRAGPVQLHGRHRP
ncbi:hypothetical protein GCM10010176_102500 [Nonomuraea spiralis]|nr:hypothetical protein GCM10010176_102500 [Nonomuraea spiralis]